MKIKIKIPGVLTIILLLAVSCRLDVIEPEITSAAINQPVQDSRLNFINYELNAQNFSGNASIPVNFTVNRATLFLSVLAHNSGNIELEITNNDQSIIFKSQFSNNFPAYNRRFTDQELSRLKLTITEFTGRLIVRMSAGLQ